MTERYGCEALMGVVLLAIVVAIIVASEVRW